METHLTADILTIFTLRMLFIREDKVSIYQSFHPYTSLVLAKEMQFSEGNMRMVKISNGHDII